MLFTIFSVITFAQGEKGSSVRKAGELMSHGDREGAIAVLDETINKGKDLFAAYKMRAGFRHMSGDIDGAIADYTAALAIKPEEAGLYDQRALLRTFRRDQERALHDYDLAISYGMKTEKVLCRRGFVKRDLGDLDGALADYKTALGMDPGSAQAAAGISGVLEKKGDRDGAITTLENFLSYLETETSGKLPKSKSTETGEAILIKRDGVEKDGSQLAMGGLGTTIVIKGDSQEDIERQIEKQERIASLAFAYSTLARLYRDKPDYEKALVNIEKSLSIQNSPLSIALRGNINLNRGKYNLAINDLTTAINALPSMTGGYLADRGIAFLTLGKDVEAQRDFDQYLQKFPNGKENLQKRIDEAKKGNGPQ